MNERKIFSIFWWVCALEGLWPLLSLGFNSQQIDLQSLANITPLRLGLIVLIVLLMAVFAWLGFKTWRAAALEQSLRDRFFAWRFTVLLFFGLFISGLVVLYVFVLSPMRIERLIEYYIRWQPFLLWLVLVVAQFFLLVLLLGGWRFWADAWRDLYGLPRVQKIQSWLNSPTGGLLLLALAFGIGLSKVVYGRFVDEADNLTLGWLITEGYTLYGDVFSHHFPFPYYWVAAVVGLFGNSFVAVRVSILVLQFALFAASMRFSKFYLVTGLTALVWNLISQFHRGQEAIYATFAGLFMITIFIDMFWILVKKPVVRKTMLVWIGLLLGVSVLTSPLMVYPAGATLLALLASGRDAPSGERLRLAFQRLFGAGLGMAVVVGVFVVQLVITRTVDDFYRDAIVFNAEVYADYVDADPNRLDRIATNLLTGLKIFDPKWVTYTSPFLPLDTYRSVKLENEHQYFSWAFSSLLFRISTLAVAFGLLLKRKYLAAIFLYVFAAALMVREDDGIYTMGFSLVGLWAGFYLFLNLRRLPNSRFIKDPGAIAAKVAQAGWVSLVSVVALMLSWSAFRGGYYIADHWYWITNDRHITMYEAFGDGIHQITCDADVELAVYPINPIIHFVTEIPPASRYVFMYPWVADVGQETLIQELSQNPVSLVWINTARKAGSGEGAGVYMADTLEFLAQEYINIGPDIWMSPQLAENCSFDPAQVPFLSDDGAE